VNAVAARYAVNALAARRAATVVVARRATTVVVERYAVSVVIERFAAFSSCTGGCDDTTGPRSAVDSTLVVVPTRCKVVRGLPVDLMDHAVVLGRTYAGRVAVVQC